MAGTDGTKGRAEEGIGLGPAIILVDPQMGENIGTTARAMLNFGLTDLRLVRPRDGWPNPRAVSAASGADIVLDGARLFETTADAAADCRRLFATTARPRDMVKPVATPRGAASEIRAAENEGMSVGILFGAERTGLVNDDVALADTVITAPLNPSFSSLNLAQAVLLIASEYRQAKDVTPANQLQTGDSPLADTKALVNLFEHLEGALDEAEFFRVAEKRPSMVRALRNMLGRANLTEQEVRTWHGIVTALAGRRKDGSARFERRD
ncbi:MAG: RNA methyltransferase [Pseudomonadota bacterium]